MFSETFGTFFLIRTCIPSLCTTDLAVSPLIFSFLAIARYPEKIRKSSDRELKYLFDVARETPNSQNLAMILGRDNLSQLLKKKVLQAILRLLAAVMN